MSKKKQVLVAVGISAIAVLFVVAWGIIISNRWGVSEVPSILLGSINAIAMVALAGLTFRYVVATNQMAMAMRDQTDAIFTPRILMNWGGAGWTKEGRLGVVAADIRHERGEVALNLRMVLVQGTKILADKRKSSPMVEGDKWDCRLADPRMQEELDGDCGLRLIAEYEDIRGIELHSMISLEYDPSEENQKKICPNRNGYAIARMGHLVSDPGYSAGEQRT